VAPIEPRRVAPRCRRGDVKSAAARTEERFAASGELTAPPRRHRRSRADRTRATRRYISTCSGSPLNYNAVSHECRVDHTDGKYDVLTTRMKGKRIPDVNVEMHVRPGSVDNTTYDTFYGAEVVRWNRETNTLEPLYDMFEFASPENAMFPMAWNTVTAACSGTASLTGVEYANTGHPSVVRQLRAAVVETPTFLTRHDVVVSTA
jgi:hypothetical protein